MDKEDELLKKRFAELSRRADNSARFFFTSFLDLASQDLLHTVMREEKNVNNYEVFGGYEGAERVMARFGNEESFGYSEPYPLCAVKISPLGEKFAKELSHRDYLGALMNMGIERSTLGDILISGKTAYVFCTRSIAGAIDEELTRVGNVPVKTDITETVDVEIQKSFEEVNVLVSSERLDAVLSKLYNLSRSDSNELFSSSRVYVNARLCTNNSITPKPGDVISARGFGKFVYDGVKYENKKGKLNVGVRKYV